MRNKYYFFVLIFLVSIVSSCKENFSHQLKAKERENLNQRNFHYDFIGTVWEIPQVKDRITIDGKLDFAKKQLTVASIFANQKAEKVENSDFSGNVFLAWNKKGIYAFIEVIDDKHYESNTHAYWKGDDIELFFSFDRKRINLVQFSIAPGFGPKYHYKRIMEHDYRNDSLKKHPLLYEIETQKTEKGYNVEVFFEFSSFNITPVENTEMAVQVYFNDYDKYKDPDDASMQLYYTARSYSNPLASQRIKLTKNRQKIPFQVKSYIKDRDSLMVYVFADTSWIGKEVKICDTMNVKNRGKIIRLDDFAEYKHSFSLAELDTTLPLAIYIDDQISEVIEIGIVPMVFDHKKSLPYESDIRMFETLDKCYPPDKNPVLFIGSSSIKQWRSLEDDFHEFDVLNRGFGGSRIEHVLMYSDRIVFPNQPSKIVLYEGDNDMVFNITPQQFVDSCVVFFDKVKQLLPGTEVLVLSIKPSPARKRYWTKMKTANQLLKEYAERHDFLTFVDISTPMFDEKGNIKRDIWRYDKLHMNDKGYEIWTNTLKPYLQN